MNELLHKQISDIVSGNRVVLFMKGTQQMPQCGFSAKVVQILDELIPSYTTVDVLSFPELRGGIKEFSEWPTIPQLYVDGQFVGGCDIVSEMNDSGELRNLFGAESPRPLAPKITLTEAAKKAFAAAAPDAGEESLRLQINANFEHDLFYGPRARGDIEVRTNGPVLLLDRASGLRANGISIDFVGGPGGGFKVTNPNEPSQVKDLTAPELKAIKARWQASAWCTERLPT